MKNPEKVDSFENLLILFHEDVEIDRDYDSVVAWDVMDEPNCYAWGDFKGNPKTEVPKLWGYMTMLYSIAKNFGLTKDGAQRLTLFNLSIANKDNMDDVLGSCARLGLQNGYNRMLDYLETLYHPQIWSYDEYPFRLKKGVVDWDCLKNDENITVDYTVFFEYLERFSKRSQSGKKIPFWTFGRCSGKAYYTFEDEFMPSSTTPNPTEGMLSFEVMNALAYGAQGILYYSYGNEDDFYYPQKDDDASMENKKTKSYNTGSPIEIKVTKSSSSTGENKNVDQSDNGDYIEIYKGVTFDVVKKVNEMIRKLNSVFWKCEVEKVFHAYKEGLASEFKSRVAKQDGDNDTETEPQKYISSYGPLSGVEYPNPDNNKGDAHGCVLSFIKTPKGNNYVNYMVLVNHDPFQNQEVILNLKTGVTVYYLNLESHEGVEEQIESFIGSSKSQAQRIKDTVTLNLQPGGVKVLLYEM